MVWGPTRTTKWRVRRAGWLEIRAYGVHLAAGGIVSFPQTPVRGRSRRIDRRARVRSPARRVQAGLERGDVDDIALGRIHDFGLGLLEPLAAHLVGIPSVIAPELKAFVRDVLGDAGDEVARAEHFKIVLDLRVHPRAVNNRVPGAVGLHFIHRERVADDVLGQPLHVLAVAGRHPLATVDVEPRMLPTTQHVRPFGRQEPLLDQERDDPRAEEFLQRREAHVGHQMKKPAVHEEPVGYERMEVRVEVEVFAEGMDGHDDAGRALRQPELGALELGQAAVGDAAKFLDEPAMKSIIRAQHLGDGELEMPVWHGRKDGLGQQRAEELHLLLVVGGAEPATLARKR